MEENENTKNGIAKDSDTKQMLPTLEEQRIRAIQILENQRKHNDMIKAHKEEKERLRAENEKQKTAIEEANRKLLKVQSQLLQLQEQEQIYRAREQRMNGKEHNHEPRKSEQPLIVEHPKQNDSVLRWFMQRSTRTKAWLMLNPVTTLLMGVMFGKSDLTVSVIAFLWIAWFFYGVFAMGSKILRG